MTTDLTRTVADVIGEAKREFEATDKRAAFIAGLREFADWLETHPDVPAPRHGEEIRYFVNADDDAAGQAEVNRLADLIGRAPIVKPGTSRRVHVEFSGGVEYVAIYHTRNVMARHAAASSYHGFVEPEDGAS